MLNNRVSKAVRLAIAFGATSTAAFTASSAIAAEESAESFEKIQVTGSRIKRADMEGANPVQLITRDDLIASGISNVGDILQEIPSVAGAATNTAVNNGGTGAVRVSLRGLGSERTLVLLNGRRVVASGSGADSSVDLSTIPTAIIKRVEVLKDGASAIYGSDAVGGVVNIITRNDFEGFEANAMYDASTHGGDGETKSYDFTVGFSGDKGNVVVSAYYSEYGAQMSGDRDWSKFKYNLSPSTGDMNKGGSSAIPWGFYNGINSQDDDLCQAFTHGAANGPGQSDPTQFTNPTGYDCFDAGKDLYNFAPANFHLTPSERYGLFAQANYEFSDSLRFFTEMNFNRRSSDTKLAPLPLGPLAFFGWTDATYSKDNYYNQQFGPKSANGESVDIADWRRRVVETGGRDTTFRVETVRAVFGFEGDISDTWGYEVSYIFGRNDGAINRAGGVNFEKVSEAVGPSFLDATSGQVLCGTPDNVIEGCVSLNTFGIPGTDSEISKEMLDFISFEAHDLGYNEQQILSASVFGDAFELPAGTVGVAVGVEHREEKGADLPDALIALGITSGNPREKTLGAYSVDEIYMETNIPLLSGAPLAEVLELDLAVRYSDYDTFGDTTNHKVGIRWSPIDGLMFRGTSSTAFRAPSTSDLFLGASASSPEVTDPCASNPTQFCLADGVPASGFTPIGDQLSSTLGGNTELQPEEADIVTFGLVYSPEFVEGLSFTVDYWDIELTNAITQIGEQLILNKCASEGTYCDKISRYTSGPLLGNSSDIDNRTVNVGGIDSSGIDFNLRYATDTAFGALTFNLDSTRYDTYDITQADGSVVENAGWYYENGGDGNFPEWKTNVDIRLAKDDWSAGYAIRYIGESEEPFGDPAEGEPASRMVDSQVIHDVRFSYFFDNFTTTIGVDNVFDEDPPYAATGFNDNTDPRTYNTTGRHVYLSLGVAF
ncbi:TonB-dependent receptor [Pseudoalteromonas sp. A25]|uniref:TonB-dependent receptor domain-containing protein n=1 Tax=Pseudoalteromonas sp. A25 TaxID=116092 RepID=UPI00126055CE|nr:TonB-dependent receptor [Pseudoalteromonas sp. A25]BBN80899.1 TonB-dependent receptor [Pseudoalteromonas sp. A25]